MSLNLILADAPAPAQPPTWMTLVPFALMFVALYFVLIRPQSKKAKEHAEMLKAVKPGDKVITSGGVVGTVVSVKERTMSIRSAESKFEVLKSAVTEITERAGDTGAGVES
jgi:preprotein translocase subunit YajC